MKIAEKPELLLELMKKHEEALARLYTVFADKFFEYENFWKAMSCEETQHAKWLDSLQSNINESSEKIIVQRFPIAAIETSLRYVNRLIQDAAQPNFTLINAISEALHLEEALIENKYFEVLEGDSIETKHILNLLSNDTKRHFQQIRQLWVEIK